MSLIQKRQESTDDFNKAFFKLLINCVYAKSMENIRRIINVTLINDSKEYLKCVSKPNFILQKIFGKNFIAVHQIKTVLTLNKLIYVGFCILELSKLLMYQFHYDYVLKTLKVQNYCSHTLIVWFMKLMVIMFMNSVLKTKIYLILVDIQKILYIMTFQTKKY